MNEYLTADDVRLLESCYARCSCGACTPRREAIAKALRIIGASGLKPSDPAPDFQLLGVDEMKAFGADQAEAWVNGSWEDVGQDATESGQPKDDPL
jgi:hypothetical protein